MTDLPLQGRLRTNAIRSAIFQHVTRQLARTRVLQTGLDTSQLKCSQVHSLPRQPTLVQHVVPSITLGDDNEPGFCVLRSACPQIGFRALSMLKYHF